MNFSLEKRNGEDIDFDFLKSQQDEEGEKNKEDLPIYTLMA